MHKKVGGRQSGVGGWNPVEGCEVIVEMKKNVRGRGRGVWSAGGGGVWSGGGGWL